MTQAERVEEIRTYCERRAAMHSQMACDGYQVSVNAAKADVWKEAASVLADVVEYHS